MLLNQLIAMFLPAIISVDIHIHMDNKKGEMKIIRSYLRAILLINVIVYFVLIYLLRNTDFIFTNQFTLKYLLLSIVFAIVLPLVEKLIKSNVLISVEMEPNDVKKI